MNDKTLVERLRDLQNDDCEYVNQCGLARAVGVEHCITKHDYGCNACLNETIQAIADTIEREYMPRDTTSVVKSVLDADGVPIHVGDTVWFEGESYRVTDVYWLDGEDSGVDLESFSTVFGEPTKTITNAWNELVTHRQPDSLERIEDDAEKNVCVYFDKQGNPKCSGCDKSLDPYLECHREMMLDLLRRQRVVLERDRG